MGFSKENFEMFPSLLVVRSTLPKFAVVKKKACLKEKFKSNVDYLNWGVRAVAGGSKFDGIFDIVDQSFNGLIGVIGRFEALIIFLELRRGDVSVLGIEMVEDAARQYVSVANITLIKCTDVCLEKELLEGLVGVDVGDKSGGGNAVIVTEVRDDSAGCVGWGDGIGARVDRNNKGCVGKCVVRRWRDGEEQVSKLAIAKIGVDQYSVGIELAV